MNIQSLAISHNYWSWCAHLISSIYIELACSQSNVNRWHANKSLWPNEIIVNRSHAKILMIRMQVSRQPGSTAANAENWNGMCEFGKENIRSIRSSIRADCSRYCENWHKVPARVKSLLHYLLILWQGVKCDERKKNPYILSRSLQLMSPKLVRRFPIRMNRFSLQSKAKKNCDERKLFPVCFWFVIFWIWQRQHCCVIAMRIHLCSSERKFEIRNELVEHGDHHTWDISHSCYSA